MAGTSAAEGKRKRGRPRVHDGESTVVGVRMEKRRAIQFGSLIAAIKLADQRTNDLDADILLEALEHRLRALANRNPQIVERTLRAVRKS